MQSATLLTLLATALVAQAANPNFLDKRGVCQTTTLTLPPSTTTLTLPPTTLTLPPETTTLTLPPSTVTSTKTVTKKCHRYRERSIPTPTPNAEAAWPPGPYANAEFPPGPYANGIDHGHGGP